MAIDKLIRTRFIPWESGRLKPMGKLEKRLIHKKIRKMEDISTNRHGIYNAVR